MDAMVAKGPFRIGEAQSASWVLSRRLTGFGPVGYLILMAVMFAAMLLMTSIVDAVVPKGSLYAVVFPVSIAAVGIACWFGFVRWRRFSVTRAWTRRGFANPIPTSFRIDPEALIVETPAATTRLRWSGVTEITPSKRHWLFIANGLAYCLPRRFFADIGAEKAYIRASLDQLSPEAVGRSKAALTFVG